MSQEEKQGVIEEVLEESRNRYRLQPGDRALSREEFMAAVERWKERGRLSDPWDTDLYSEVRKRMKEKGRGDGGEEFNRTMKELKMEKFESGKYFDWIEGKHILSVARGKDIELLLEVKASICKRFSDEALYELDEIDQWIRWLGRSRYRPSPGVCREVKENR